MIKKNKRIAKALTSVAAGGIISVAAVAQACTPNSTPVVPNTAFTNFIDNFLFGRNVMGSSQTFILPTRNAANLSNYFSYATFSSAAAGVSVAEYASNLSINHPISVTTTSQNYRAGSPRTLPQVILDNGEQINVNVQVTRITIPSLTINQSFNGRLNVSNRSFTMTNLVFEIFQGPTIFDRNGNEVRNYGGTNFQQESFWNAQTDITFPSGIPDQDAIVGAVTLAYEEIQQNFSSTSSPVTSRPTDAIPAALYDGLQNHYNTRLIHEVLIPGQTSIDALSSDPTIRDNAATNNGSFPYVVEPQSLNFDIAGTTPAAHSIGDVELVDADGNVVTDNPSEGIFVGTVAPLEIRVTTRFRFSITNQPVFPPSFTPGPITPEGTAPTPANAYDYTQGDLYVEYSIIRDNVNSNDWFLPTTSNGNLFNWVRNVSFYAPGGDI